MLVILIKRDLHLLKVALIFLSKIMLSQCDDYFIFLCSSSIVELCKHLRIFLEHSRSGHRRSTSLVFLKIAAGLYNSTMHSSHFFF